MHSQGDLWLAPISPKVSFPNEQTDQQTFVELRSQRVPP